MIKDETVHNPYWKTIREFHNQFDNLMLSIQEHRQTGTKRVSLHRLCWTPEYTEVSEATYIRILEIINPFDVSPSTKLLRLQEVLRFHSSKEQTDE